MQQPFFKLTALAALTLGLAACGGGSKTDSADAGASQQNAKKGGAKRSFIALKAALPASTPRNTPRAPISMPALIRSTTAWLNSNAAKPKSNPRWPKAGIFHPTAKPTPSTCAKA